MSESYSSIRALLNGGPSVMSGNDLIARLPPPVGQEPKLSPVFKPNDRRRKIDSLADTLREKQAKRKLSNDLSEDDSTKFPSSSAIVEPVPLPVETESQYSIADMPSSTNVVLPIGTEQSSPDSMLRYLLDGSDSSSVSQKFQPPIARELTPKLSRHNDAAYYPNIQCILCQEWVCSRNRYMHIESHLQYRPYRCSQCGYDNRKEIFINLHIKRSHKGVGNVVYHPNPDLEHRAWVIAEQCLQHTRKVLMKESHDVEGEAAPKNSAPDSDPEKKELDPDLLQSYETAYRPKIFNSQRLEKSQLIEESRQLGLVPDFSEVANREEKCRTCGSHLLRHHHVLEEHVRTHLPLPTYQCNIDGCTVEHHSKNFISRHMKEVHKHRRSPLDLLEDNTDLIREFQRLCQMSFPDFFDLDTISRIRFRLTTQPQQTVASRNSVLSELLSRKNHGLASPEPKTFEVLPSHVSVDFSEHCSLCDHQIIGHYSDVYDHVKTHLKTPPFQCSLCGFSGSSKKSILLHIFQSHHGSPESAGSMVRSSFTSQVSMQCDSLMSTCFPTVPLKRNLHDSVDNPGMGVLICNLCHKGIAPKDKIRHAELHLMHPILKCHYCPFKNSDEAAMNQHTRSVHNSDLYLIATPSASTDRASQIEIMKDECFVNKH